MLVILSEKYEEFTKNFRFYNYSSISSGEFVADRILNVKNNTSIT